VKTPEERFWSKVDKTSNPNGCWEWTGGKIRNGYGSFTLNCKSIVSHRFSYELYNGSIPTGLHVLHKCDNRICVNPNHLFLGTNQDNMSDKVAKGRQAKGSTIGKAKLTEEQVLDIKTHKITCKEYAKKYGITMSTIYDIWNRKTWTHI
jgi:hypothetical protein